MLLIELTTLTTSARMKNLGVSIDKSDYIQVNTFIDVGKITHLSENPESKELTNIYLTNGAMLMTGVKLVDLVTYMQEASYKTEQNV